MHLSTEIFHFPRFNNCLSYSESAPPCPKQKPLSNCVSLFWDHQPMFTQTTCSPRSQHCIGSRQRESKVETLLLSQCDIVLPECSGWIFHAAAHLGPQTLFWFCTLSPSLPPYSISPVSPVAFLGSLLESQDLDKPHHSGGLGRVADFGSE